MRQTSAPGRGTTTHSLHFRTIRAGPNPTNGKPASIPTTPARSIPPIPKSRSRRPIPYCSARFRLPLSTAWPITNSASISMKRTQPPIPRSRLTSSGFTPRPTAISKARRICSTPPCAMTWIPVPMCRSCSAKPTRLAAATMTMPCWCRLPISRGSTRPRLSFIFTSRWATPMAPGHRTGSPRAVSRNGTCRTR